MSAGSNPAAPDSGDDALRRAKYLVSYRPAFFTLSAIGVRLDYAVRYDGRSQRSPAAWVPYA